MFLVASAIPLSLVYLFLAPIMFVPICLLHIPHAIMYSVALAIVQGSMSQPKRRLYWTSAIVGLIMGVVDVAVDIVAVSTVPELERSPFRPVVRVLVGSALCLLLSWMILRIRVSTSARHNKGEALNNRVEDIAAGASNPHP